MYRYRSCLGGNKSSKWLAVLMDATTKIDSLYPTTDLLNSPFSLSFSLFSVLTSSENEGLSRQRKTIHTFYRRPIKLLMRLLQVCYSIVQSIILDT